MNQQNKNMKIKIISLLLLIILLLVGCSNYDYVEETNPQIENLINVEQENNTPTERVEIIQEEDEPTIVEFYPDEILADAEPYLDEIITENQKLRKFAAEISEGCPDKECRAVEIFDYVIMNYEYIDDPRGSEYIQSPFQTVDIGGGDCEDFTILINSLMENVGIETKLVLTEDHAYSLVCGLDVDTVNNYVADKLIDTTWDEYYDEISYYNFDDMDCIVGDGANGYYLGDDVGMEAYERYAVDPITLTIDFLE